MARVFISLGSNIDSAYHIRMAVQALREQFGPLLCSRVYESEAVGFTGDNFLNMVVAFDSEESVGEICRRLRAIEDRYGRDRSTPRFSSRSLDLDLLLYGEQFGEIDGVTLPRKEIPHNAFVLWPLSELAPDAEHPELKQSYARLWQTFDKDSQPLWPIDLKP